MYADTLADKLPGKPSQGAVRNAIRILVRHGYLRDDDGVVETVDPSQRTGYPPLDVEALARREQVERTKLRQMIEYAYHPRCRRQYMLGYFGDPSWGQGARRCDDCDNCRGLGEAQPLDDEQRDHLADVLGLVARVSGRFGRTRLAAMAVGTDDDDRFADLPERGCVRGQSAAYAKDLLRALEGAGLVDVSSGDYPTLLVTPAGNKVVRGDRDLDGIGVMLRSKRKTPKARRTRAEAADLGPADSALANALRQWRTRASSERSVPAYVIFSNRTLDELARRRPTTLDQLAQVHGIGPSRLEAFGVELLAAIERSFQTDGSSETEHRDPQPRG
jgi:ATP-dependent DNA helicase RecQ